MAGDVYVLDDDSAREITAAVRDLRARPPTAGRRARRPQVVRTPLPKFSTANVYNNGATISVPNNAWTALAFNAEYEDADGYHDNVTNNTRLTVPTGLLGHFFLAGCVDFAANATGQRGIRVRNVGGGTGEAVLVDAAAAGNTTLFVADLTGGVGAGAAYELEVFQNSGAALNVNVGSGAATRFWIFGLQAGGGGGGGLTLNASTLAGRGSAAGAGAEQEITLGSGLSMSGTTLSSTGGGGAPDTGDNLIAGAVFGG